MNTQVKSASRVLDVLEYVATTDEPCGPTDISLALGIPKSSAHMLLTTLKAKGYLVRDGARGFRLAPELKNVSGWIGGLVGRIVKAATPVIDRLVGKLEETSVLGVLTPRTEVRVVASRISPLAVRYEVGLQPILPTYCTALGHAMLAFTDDKIVNAYLARTELVAVTPKTPATRQAVLRRLKQVRTRGYSLNIDERFVGASGAATPILTPEGRAVAAINIATVTPRFHDKREKIIEALKAAAAEIQGTVFHAGVAAK